MKQLIGDIAKDRIEKLVNELQADLPLQPEADKVYRMEGK